VFDANDASPRDQLQSRIPVQFGRPTDRKFDPSTRQKWSFGREQDTVAADVDRIAHAGFI
jgi:hypothetical protein